MSVVSYRGWLFWFFGFFQFITSWDVALGTSSPQVPSLPLCCLRGSLGQEGPHKTRLRQKLILSQNCEWLQWPMLLSGWQQCSTTNAFLHSQWAVQRKTWSLTCWLMFELVPAPSYPGLAYLRRYVWGTAAAAAVAAAGRPCWHDSPLRGCVLLQEPCQKHHVPGFQKMPSKGWDSMGWGYLSCGKESSQWGTTGSEN